MSNRREFVRWGAGAVGLGGFLWLKNNSEYDLPNDSHRKLLRYAQQADLEPDVEQTLERVLDALEDFEKKGSNHHVNSKSKRTRERAKKVGDKLFGEMKSLSGKIKQKKSLKNQTEPQELREVRLEIGRRANEMIEGPIGQGSNYSANLYAKEIRATALGWSKSQPQKD